MKREPPLFRGGPKSRRDKNFGIKNDPFWRWYHRVYKPRVGLRDLETREEAEAAFHDWENEGSPVPK